MKETRLSRLDWDEESRLKKLQEQPEKFDHLLYEWTKTGIVSKKFFLAAIEIRKDVVK